VLSCACLSLLKEIYDQKLFAFLLTITKSSQFIKRNLWSKTLCISSHYHEAFSVY